MKNQLLSNRYDEYLRLSTNSKESSEYFITNGYGEEESEFRNVLKYSELYNSAIILYFHDLESMNCSIPELKQLIKRDTSPILRGPKINFHAEKIMFGCNTKIYTYAKPDKIPRRLSGIKSNKDCDHTVLLHGVTLTIFLNNHESITAFVSSLDKLFNGGKSIARKINFTRDDDARNLFNVIRENYIL